jgi:hypothetical protein
MNFIRLAISDMKACSLKGPNMAEFVPAVWVPQKGLWYWDKYPFTLSQLQQESLGGWELKLVNNNDQESIYTFTISGSIEDSEFSPVPELLEPATNAANLIAEDYTLSWNSNGAEGVADFLAFELAGNSFFYSSTIDLSAAEWNPGWLELGSGYCKVGYFRNRSDIITSPILVSGPAISWESYMAFLTSGDRHNFTVKYSLDLIDDNVIDLADLKEFCLYWLEPSSNIADFDDNGIVSFGDFAIFSRHWLEGM